MRRHHVQDNGFLVSGDKRFGLWYSLCCCCRCWTRSEFSCPWRRRSQIEWDKIGCRITRFFRKELRTNVCLYSSPPPSPLAILGFSCVHQSLCSAFCTVTSLRVAQPAGAKQGEICCTQFPVSSQRKREEKEIRESAPRIP